MKIRIKDNTVRFRLTKSEVAKLAADGRVGSSTSFVDGTFQYGVEVVDSDALSAGFVNGAIVLRMPMVMASALANTDQVGFEGMSGQVKLLVEKDFVCIDNTTEDQSDNYPHPNLGC
ncbi:hypothetical protein BC792_112124 [Sphingobacterium allocomposti]|uniref:Uncharacterized protein n=1 Tax=Sphingobacterium allocomposti TaxID=415956 RepID=A0A5S5DIH1_9SPHI|nr:hypothetical protein [Sphingobacterium composti Yoo et al. 2007 non Ten et al. 2007]TYP94459.1 hypothetical protein BC792_112124 [Sphingobacterium composti Yoo et al. 2007 non Ten et al. 2007]